jgi:hypothetical protein
MNQTWTLSGKVFVAMASLVGSGVRTDAAAGAAGRKSVGGGSSSGTVGSTTATSIGDLSATGGIVGCISTGGYGVSVRWQCQRLPVRMLERATVALEGSTRRRRLHTPVYSWWMLGHVWSVDAWPGPKY